MKELIKITEHNGQQAVSARELHKFLEVTERFNSWCDRMFSYGFIENQDYTSVKSFTVVNNGAKKEVDDYALTIDCAKEISMLQRSEKGKTARRYFITCEKKLKEIKPLSQVEIVAQSAQILLEQSKKIEAIESDVKTIKAQITTRPEYYTIAGYGTLIGVPCGLKLASSLGRKASKLCKERSIATEEMPDPRFGIVKTYPK